MDNYRYRTELNKFNNLRKQRQRFLGHLNFLISCKRNKVIPKFIKASCNLKPTWRVKKTMKRVHSMLLRTVIKDTRSKLAFIETRLYRLHLQLANTSIPILWNFHDRLTASFAEFVTEDQRMVHDKKLNDLLTVPHLKPLHGDYIRLLNNPKVINLSGKEISDSQVKVLELGLNFNVSNHNDIEMIKHVERGFKFSKIDPSQKEFLRNKIANILETNKCTKPNLSFNESKDLNNLVSRKDLVISSADKGGAIVVLNRQQYNEGLSRILNNGSYNVTNLKAVNHSLTSVKEVVSKSVFISSAAKRALIPSFFHPGRLYILPKIHKEQLSFRPIISGIGTPTHLLSKYIAKTLYDLLGPCTYSTINSREFVHSLRTHSPSNKIMCSFDVVNMFTSVPRSESIAALECRLSLLPNLTHSDMDSILKIVEVCTRFTVFSVNGTVYEQTRGLPMGGSLSPILCDSYLWKLETFILSNSPVDIDMWKRYVDDCFSLISGHAEDVAKLLDWLNTIDTHIKFTVEIENNEKLPFLDILIEKQNNEFQTSVYRKPFSVQLPPHARSAHIGNQKVSAFYFYVRRALDVCSNKVTLENELNFLRHVAIDRGYDPTIIDQAADKFTRPKPIPSQLVAVKKTDNSLPIMVLPYESTISSRMRSILKCAFHCVFTPSCQLRNFCHPPKDDLPPLNKWGVYYIPCKQCDMGYVGQTSRSLHYRLTEHKRNVKNCDIKKSNVAAHSWTENHCFDFDAARVIYQTNSKLDLDFLESLHITHFHSKLVNDHHFPFLSPQWSNTLSRVKLKLKPIIGGAMIDSG